MRARLEQLWIQLVDFVRAQPPARRIVLATTSVGSLVVVLGLAWWVQRPRYRSLFTNLAERDASAIVEALRAEKVPFRLEDGGRAILVPTERLYELRLALASRGLPEGGGVGFELFDRQTLGQTDFLQRLNYQRALQGELGRTISRLGGVESARVRLALPERSLFVGEDRRPSGSVMVKLAPGRALPAAQIEGIVHPVAASVEGLAADGVTVVDESGRLLTTDRRGGETVGASSTAPEMQASIERQLAERVESMLAAVVGRPHGGWGARGPVEPDKRPCRDDGAEGAARREPELRGLQGRVAHGRTGGRGEAALGRGADRRDLYGRGRGAEVHATARGGARPPEGAGEERGGLLRTTRRSDRAHERALPDGAGGQRRGRARHARQLASGAAHAAPGRRPGGRRALLRGAPARARARGARRRGTRGVPRGRHRAAHAGEPGAHAAEPRARGAAGARVAARESARGRGLRVLGVEKAAILLTTLGPEAAAAVFRHLSEPEARQVSAAIARLRSIPRAQAAAVHAEASPRLPERQGLLIDGEQFARQMITAALTGAREERPAGRAGQAGGEFLAASLDPVAPAALAQVLGREHPQVIALVLANLRARKAAEVLAALPEDLQPEIAERIADLQSVPEDLLADVGDVLAGQVQGLGRAAPRTGVLGAKLVADILNVADETVEARVFAHLEAHAPAVAEAIRGLMLTFEDLLRLDQRGMQALPKEIARDAPMLAPKTASPAMREKLFGNLAQRTAEILQEDMGLMGPVRLKDVEQAQARIVAAARRLDAEQRITLGARESDVVV